MISQREQSQTGTGRIIALAVDHLISVQEVMKSLRWPKQFKFVRQFHMPDKVLLCFIGGIVHFDSGVQVACPAEEKLNKPLSLVIHDQKGQF